MHRSSTNNKLQIAADVDVDFDDDIDDDVENIKFAIFWPHELRMQNTMISDEITSVWIFFANVLRFGPCVRQA